MTYDPNNIFAKIIRGEIPANKVFENENVLAFWDISRAAPIHVLVIPKGEYKNFIEFTTKETPQKVADFFRKVSEIAVTLGADKSGFRLISNIGSDAHQTVPHFHIHLLAGKKMGPLISSDNQLR
jgi:diadenosine tetraphosphate (Ap4A) HIT family hydrolase